MGLAEKKKLTSTIVTQAELKKTGKDTFVSHCGDKGGENRAPGTIKGIIQEGERQN